MSNEELYNLFLVVLREYLRAGGTADELDDMIRAALAKEQA